MQRNMLIPLEMIELVIPFAGNQDSNGIYARGSPWKDRESKLQASSAWSIQRMPPD